MANPNNADYVGVGKPAAVGAVFSAPTGSAAPIDASSALDAAFENWGYISEDGITNTIDSDSEEIKAFGGTVVRKLKTSRDETFTFSGIEENATVLKDQYGEDNVVVDGNAIKVTHNDAELPNKSWIFNIVLSATRIKRIYVPIGQITELGEVKYNGSDPVGREVTMSALPDAQGNTAYEWIEEV